jgi:hypothetical protein
MGNQILRPTSNTNEMIMAKTLASITPQAIVIASRDRPMMRPQFGHINPFVEQSRPQSRQGSKAIVESRVSKDRARIFLE